MAEEFNNNQNPQSNNAQQPVYYSAPAPAPAPKKKSKAPIIIGIIAGIIVLGIIIGALSGGSGDDDKTTKAQINAANSADGKTTVDAASDSTDEDGVIGDYVCVVKEAKICKNWEGKDAVRITYSFTNNSSDSESFDIALSDEVYQDGVQLETSFTDADEDDWGVDVKIKPGMSKDVSKVYLLRDTKTDLEVEISEFISFSDDKLVTTVKLEK